MLWCLVYSRKVLVMGMIKIFGVKLVSIFRPNGTEEDEKKTTARKQKRKKRKSLRWCTCLWRYLCLSAALWRESIIHVPLETHPTSNCSTGTFVLFLFCVCKSCLIDHLISDEFCAVESGLWDIICLIT